MGQAPGGRMTDEAAPAAALPQPATGPLVLELAGAAPAGGPLAVAADGTVTLATETLRWEVDLTRVGSLTAEIVYAGEPGMGGTVALELGSQEVTGRVSPTGGAGMFITAILGKFKITKREKYPVVLRTVPRTEGPTLILKTIRLVPRKG